MDYQSFGKKWDKATTPVLQGTGWGWGSSISKIGHQDKHKTIQKGNNERRARGECVFEQGGEEKRGEGEGEVEREVINTLLLFVPTLTALSSVLVYFHDLTWRENERCSDVLWDD